MNSLVSRFASTSAINELHPIDGIEDGEVPDTMWGSSAGFGNLGMAGALSFNIPAVPDVRRSSMLEQLSLEGPN